MRMTVLIAIVTGLFAGERVQLMGGTSARRPRGVGGDPEAAHQRPGSC